MPFPIEHARAAALTFLLACACAPLCAQTTDLGDALVRAEELVRSHRYQDVVELLTPHLEAATDPELVYALAAEVGRANFHLGQYAQAEALFRRAVSIHPEHAETALYLQACLYINGHREQALMIFREILATGSDDLYLAVTLPGERSFLADHDVWAAIEQHTKTVTLDLERATALGVHLGQDRGAVLERLGARPDDPLAPVVTARAGPKLIWSFGFDDNGALSEIEIHSEHLLKYTPYRLQMSNGLDWRATPAAASALLGPPDRTESDEDGVRVLTWTYPAHEVHLFFGRPRAPAPPPIPPDSEMLLVVELVRLQSAPQAP